MVEAAQPGRATRPHWAAPLAPRQRLPPRKSAHWMPHQAPSPVPSDRTDTQLRADGAARDLVHAHPTSRMPSKTNARLGLVPPSSALADLPPRQCLRPLSCSQHPFWPKQPDRLLAPQCQVELDAVDGVPRALPRPPLLKLQPCTSWSTALRYYASRNGRPDERRLSTLVDSLVRPDRQPNGWQRVHIPFIAAT